MTAKDAMLDRLNTHGWITSFSAMVDGRRPVWAPGTKERMKIVGAWYQMCDIGADPFCNTDAFLTIVKRVRKPEYVSNEDIEDMLEKLVVSGVMTKGQLNKSGMVNATWTTDGAIFVAQFDEWSHQLNLKTTPEMFVFLSIGWLVYSEVY